MSNASAQTARVLSGDAASPDSRRSPHGTRRRLLLLGCLVLLVVVGVAANYGPVRHYQEARDRLEKTAAEVAGLEEQKAALQAQLAKLSEAGYLEGLARQELTYSRPDEELYIVTGPAGDGVTAGKNAGSEVASANEPRVLGTGEGDEESLTLSAGIGAVVVGASPVTGLGIGAAAPGAQRSGSGETGRAGFLERILTAIAELF